MCPKHIVLCFCFVCLRLVYPMLPVSLDVTFLIVPSVFSDVYLSLLLDKLSPVTSFVFIIIINQKQSCVYGTN
jgi:hypothetical protein